MAKKKAVRRKVQKKTPVLSRIQGGVKKMQRDAEALLGRARKEAVRLSHEQKRTLDRVVGQARRLRADFEKSVKRTSKDLESRSKRLLATLEKDIEKRLEPVVSRLVGPSRQEVQSLSRRVRELEQRVNQHSHAETPAAPTPAPSPPPDLIAPSTDADPKLFGIPR
jgi:polyhydroxyalkanoate synthesis regulator phasin